jgi:CDP-diacylglycerol--serine O-phosphatidyltransferase
VRGRTKRFIPNAVTITNMFLGFLAIISAFEGNFNLAAWLIFAGFIMDSMDGKLARALGTTSEFGIQFDSLADLITFCLAPSIFVYLVWAEPLGIVVGGFFAFMPLMLGSIRLARFNLESGADQKDQFLGVPTPLMAMSVIGLYLFFSQLHLIPWVNLEARAPAGDERVILPLIMIVSSLMLSKIPFPKSPPFSLRGGFRNAWRFAMILITFAAIILSRGIVIFPLAMLMILSSLVIWTQTQRMIVHTEDLEEGDGPQKT